MPLIEKIRLLHADVYTTGLKLPKQHKLGIHEQLAKHIRDILTLCVEAQFGTAHIKRKLLESARIKGEVFKHILRTEYELGVVGEKEYVRIATHIVEISKMLNGWIRYVTEKATPTKTSLFSEKFPDGHQCSGCNCRDSSS